MSGRIRSIKPEILDDEVVAELTDAAWRLWVSTWVLADDFGNLRAGLKYLAAEVWKDTSRDVSSPLQELVDKGFLVTYAVRGQRYAHINGWEKHQRIDNAGKARVPGPDEDDGTWNQQLGGLFAYSRGSRGESPLDSASGECAREPPPARALAQSGRETTIPITERDPDPTPSGISRARGPGGTYPLPDDFELTTERRKYAELVPLTDIDAVFRKFKQLAIERQWANDERGWESRWQRFCDQERVYQRRERDRGGKLRQPPAPPGTATWTAGDDHEPEEIA